MRSLLGLLSLSLFLFVNAFGQSTLNFRVILEEQPVADFPGLQAYVIGESDGKWLLIGGRKDGLHRRQPFASFDAAGMNERIYVIVPESNTSYSQPLSALPVSIAEQLQSTNMEFHQKGNTLYIVGGYGYSPTAGDHITFPYLTAVDVPGAISAIMNGLDLQPHFVQILDEHLAVTGGYLGQLGEYFYLAGGQKFIGRYNPMGPTHGPGFFQEYSNEIRRFKIQHDGSSIAISNYAAWRDTQHLHRRDYNMAPQVFPDGKRGFTMFSGVFQYEQDIPWLNTVDFDSVGYTVNNVFNQYLSQYHSAHLPMYSAAHAQMSTIFFGGMSRYRVDDVTGFLIDDPNVPFVKTISMVSRFADGLMVESKIGEMPNLLGSSAEFIPTSQAFEDGILNLDALGSDTTMVGYILGGIQSSQANIFFINTGAESVASNKLFKVMLAPALTETQTPVVAVNKVRIKATPNPFHEEMNISFNLDDRKALRLQVFDNTGRKIIDNTEKEYQAGENNVLLNLKWFPIGGYAVVLTENGNVVGTAHVIRR